MAAKGSTAAEKERRMPALAVLGDRRQRLLEELAPARFKGDEERVALLEFELDGLEDELRRMGRDPSRAGRRRDRDRD
jgi:hypothetical protein